VDTGSIDADGVTALGLELGLQHRNLSLQGEHFWIDVDRRAAGADPEFSGWYVQGAWTITGEPRRYSAAAGGFDAPKVEAPFNLARRTWGVWELAARYSDLDLDYLAGAAGTAPVPGAVRGGEQKIFTLGLNWYPNGNVRFLADYQRVDVVRLSPGGAAFSALTPPAGAQVGQDYDVWSIRTQYAF
jgi:phosphate-selective porin OprO/OprP